MSSTGRVLGAAAAASRDAVADLVVGATVVVGAAGVGGAVAGASCSGTSVGGGGAVTGRLVAASVVGLPEAPVVGLGATGGPSAGASDAVVVDGAVDAGAGQTNGRRRQRPTTVPAALEIRKARTLA